MGFYQKIIKTLPKQSCVLCFEAADFCLCSKCEAQLTTHQFRCKSCAKPLPNNNLDFCGDCLNVSPTFDRAYALYDYSSPCADLIKMFKYNHKLCIGNFFAHKLYNLYQKIVKKNGAYDAIIPMPLSASRTRQRGYNQTNELLRLVKNKEDITIDVDSCKRIKSTKSLYSLNLKERKKEIKGAFKTKPMTYKKILLVDDIITTGSSFNELAKTIIKSTNIEHCDVLALARAYQL